jgi:hypothetical protein
MLGSSRVAAQLAASREGLGSMSEFPLITPRYGPQGNTVFCCQECVFIGPLPSNACPIVHNVCFGDVFTEPFPSCGHTRSDNKVRKLATVCLPWQQRTETSVWSDDDDIPSLLFGSTDKAA